ncbi:MAG: hypothetical protein J5769_05510 [Bacteroidales bacterium]|nr:hypothetical protein [Bacteroidales bacterium]
MAKKCGIQTPDGYFDSLQSRLVSIAETAPSVRKVGFARKVAPYFAYAASLVAAVLLGSFILRKTAVPEEEYSAWEENLVAEVLMSADPYALIFDSETVNP